MIHNSMPYDPIQGQGEGYGGLRVAKMANFKVLAAFFKSFRKGPVVCRGLDMNLSGKLAKKTTVTRKSGRHAHNVFPPRYRCVRNMSVSPRNAAATAYMHIKVAIVTHSHFGNAKPKFHMNCWSSISINDRGCQQRCITRPANI